jgi:decaprenyl-phosphate phosphoribosyltransferase
MNDHRRPTLQHFVRSARPVQWFRNLLVFAAPIAGGVITDPTVFRSALTTFVAFCSASSGIYYLNDVMDIEADRAHPTKSQRPIAAGWISRSTATTIGLLLVIAAFVLAFSVSWETAAMVLSYVLLITVYSAFLKQQPVLDVMTIASGFLLRAVAGGVATGIEPSRWFIIVVGFASLFSVTVKRSAESKGTGGGGETRGVLSIYSDGYLDAVRIVSLSGALIAYCLWAFERAETSMASFPWSELSIVPVAYALLKYELLARTTAVERPEDLVLRDQGILVSGLVWSLFFVLATSFA